MSRHSTLSRWLALVLSAGFSVVLLLSVLATALVLRLELRELMDSELRETAELFRPILSEDWHRLTQSGAIPAPPHEADPRHDELVYALVHADGQVLLRSHPTEAFALPEGPILPGFVETETHVFFTTEPDGDGHSVQVGDPKQERREAFFESLLAFLVPILAITPLAFVMVRWIVRLALRPLENLRAEIAARDSGRLDPIDGAQQPAELKAITRSLNGFMIRLSSALESERSFATNAAHELRTPVAVALGQVQRLREELGETSPAQDRIDRAEAALERMGRLVARLLELARAEAGIGLSQTPNDLRKILRVVVEEISRRPGAETRVCLNLPDEPVCSRMDPDAFAIVAGNLLDNALRHAPDTAPIRIDLSREGKLRCANGGANIPAGELTGLTERFNRRDKTGKGFGLGLYISNQIIRQSGGTLNISSPPHDMPTGVEVAIDLPLAR